MKYLIVGSGSFLGNNFYDYLKSKNIDVYGISESNKKKDFINLNYDSNEIKKIINKLKPDYIFDFKTHLVSSNMNHYKISFDEMVKKTNNLVKAYKEIELKKINIILISTNLLNYQITNNHPYLRLKSYQEEKYKEIKQNIISVVRIPNIIGIGDINFSRLIPYCMGSYLSRKSIDLNSTQDSTREYIFMSDFFDCLFSANYLFNQKVVLTNNQIIELLNCSLVFFKKEMLNVSWGKAVNLNILNNTKLIPENLDNQGLTLKFNQIVKWYLDNKNYVINEFSSFK